MQIGEVFKRYECIQIEINTFYDQVMADLSGMEKEWIEALPDTWEFSQTDVLVSLGVLSFWVWINCCRLCWGCFNCWRCLGLVCSKDRRRH